MPYYERDDGEYVKYASILDRGINDDDEDVEYSITYYKDYKKPVVKAKLKYYVLTISDTQTMVNGFRYIKEMILQNHNYFMYKSYQKLQKHKVKVYSVNNT
jgi:hypothetical protein